MKEANIKAIIELVKKGDKAGMMQLLYACKKTSIQHLLSKTGCQKEEAEDIFIEAVLSFQEKALAGSIEDITNLQGYMNGVCYYMWQKLYKKRQNEIQKIPYIERYYYDYLRESELDAKRADEMKEQLLSISNEALTTLGDKCQDVIRYFYIEQKRMDEIADIMGFNNAEVVSTVKYRCFKRLLNKIKELEKSVKQTNE